jgi:hypothetical protein
MHSRPTWWYLNIDLLLVNTKVRICLSRQNAQCVIPAVFGGELAREFAVHLPPSERPKRGAFAAARMGIDSADAVAMGVGLGLGTPPNSDDRALAIHHKAPASLDSRSWAPESHLPGRTACFLLP